MTDLSTGVSQIRSWIFKILSVVFIAFFRPKLCFVNNVPVPGDVVYATYDDTGQMFSLISVDKIREVHLTRVYREKKQITYRSNFLGKLMFPYEGGRCTRVGHYFFVEGSKAVYSYTMRTNHLTFLGSDSTRCFDHDDYLYSDSIGDHRAHGTDLKKVFTTFCEQVRRILKHLKPEVTDIKTHPDPSLGCCITTGKLHGKIYISAVPFRWKVRLLTYLVSKSFS